MPSGIDTRRLTARQTVSRATQAAGVIPIAGAAMGPDLLRTLLRQTVGMTEIILETVAAEHQHLTATRIETSETLLGQQLGIGVPVVPLALVPLWQRARLYMALRFGRAVDRYVFSPRGAWGPVHRVWRVAMLRHFLPRPFVIALVLVVNDFADNGYTQHPYRDLCQIPIAITRGGGNGGKSRDCDSCRCNRGDEFMVQCKAHCLILSVKGTMGSTPCKAIKSEAV